MRTFLDYLYILLETIVILVKMALVKGSEADSKSNFLSYNKCYILHYYS